MNNTYSCEKFDYDNLLLTGQAPTVMDVVKVCAGSALVLGSVVGLKEDTKEAFLVDKSKTDGTQFPYGIIAETVFNPESFEAVVYVQGEFNADALIFAEGCTVEDFRYDMNRVGLMVRDTQNRGI